MIAINRFGRLKDICSKVARACASLRRDRRGNVLMIFAFAVGPVTFATGMSIDYGSAMRMQTKLSSAADAAALAAVSHQVMSWDKALAEQAARQLFVIQTQGTPGLSINYLDKTQFDVVITETSASVNTRTATVTFRGTSANKFTSILGVSTLTIKGTAVAQASTAPDIDFYVMMDTSPSMALPINRAGLTQLTSLTGGCAFACHSINDATAFKKDGTRGSYYAVAKSYGIPLRSEAEIEATRNMISLAKTTGIENNAAYRFSLSSFDVAGNFKNIGPLTDNFDTARAKANDATLLQVYSNNNIRQNVNNNDMDTSFIDMFAQAQLQMPVSPGNGTGKPGDTPQAMMFIITDGMRDEEDRGRKMGAIPTAACNTIKARGIRIAILYTEYLPESLSDGWSQTNVAPLLPGVAPALENCASSGLYYKVTTDDDITGALASLFQKAVATARLTR